MSRPKFLPGDPRNRELGKRGGRVSAEQSKQRALDRVRAVWPAMPEAAAAVILAYVAARVATALTTRARRERKARQ